MKNIEYTAFCKVVISCLLLFLAYKPSRAQDITLTRNQLKAYEGVFQSQQNNDRRVQFKSDSNSLQAKLLWNGGQLRLYSESDTDFRSKEGETINVTFVKDSDGHFNQLSVDGNGLWDRVKNYKPFVKTELPHTPFQLQTFQGLYQFQGDSNRYIQLTAKDNELILKQHWDGQAIPFVPDSTWEFFNKVQLTFTLHFVKGADSVITGVLVFRTDLWNKVAAIQYSTNQLHAFEGKYQLKDDKDDIIQIRSSGNALIIKQLWDGKETIISPLANCYFYNTTEAFPAKFIKDENGTITSAIMLSGDLFEKIKE